MLATNEEAQKDPSMISVDSDGHQWVVGNCSCDTRAADAIVGAVADVVFEALTYLPNILCAVALQSLEEIAEIGVKFIPGVGEAMTATKLAVQAAKTITENALTSDDFFDGVCISCQSSRTMAKIKLQWIGKVCKVPATIQKPEVFLNLNNMPDSLGVSQGCKLSDKSQCKPVAPVADKPPAPNNLTPMKVTSASRATSTATSSR
jgi:hypothetical protein